MYLLKEFDFSEYPENYDFKSTLHWQEKYDTAPNERARQITFLDFLIQHPWGAHSGYVNDFELRYVQSPELDEDDRQGFENMNDLVQEVTGMRLVDKINVQKRIVDQEATLEEKKNNLIYEVKYQNSGPILDIYARFDEQDRGKSPTPENRTMQYAALYSPFMDGEAAISDILGGLGTLQSSDSQSQMVNGQYPDPVVLNHIGRHAAHAAAMTPIRDGFKILTHYNQD
ncbi:MAG: hypothetical protein U5J95_11730 [Balneolaceae bacterium]|nr:hypothetical protein [Balneolaceae bacterium]